MNIHVVLFQPVIPQNTGSIARLCACTGATLHLIHPLGFKTDAASVRRAGLDYWDHVAIREYPDWDDFLKTTGAEALYFFSKFATRAYTAEPFPADRELFFVFGSETKGLPDTFHEKYADRLLLLPMRTHLVRSLNLSQAAAIVVYEALRQKGFEGVQSEPVSRPGSKEVS